MFFVVSSRIGEIRRDKIRGVFFVVSSPIGEMSSFSSISVHLKAGSI